MNSPNLKRTFLVGMIVILVLGIIVYFLVEVVAVVKTFISPLVHWLGMERAFGEITMAFLAILVIIILAFIMGSISLLPRIYRYKDKIEDFLIELYPPLNYFKVMTKEKFQVDSAREEWKSVLVLIDDQYKPAFIIEENDEWVTISVVAIPNSDPMELLIVRKDSIQCLPMSMKQMLKNNRMYGKGYISLISSASKK